MTPSKKGIDLIKKYEGCYLKAYKCPAGIVTIGYGNTYYEDNSVIKMGDVITKQRAEELLLLILPRYTSIVLKRITIPLTQNQFDALLSHTYNCGGSSTLFNMINRKASFKEIREWFETKYTSANGVILPGLIKRRKEEANLFFTI